MKIAYFDCPTGISGNMMLAAFIDAGVPFSHLEKELRKLKLKDCKLILKKAVKRGLAAKHMDVEISTKERSRTAAEITGIINSSKLKPSIKSLSKKIFEKLFKAEAKVHGGHIFHLHETGATDAIIDIVGSAICLDKLGIGEVYCSPLPYGYGEINSEHGKLPNPAPATLEMLKGVPIYKKHIKAELVTPTGAAIISTIAKSFTDMPKLQLEGTGLGAGTFDLNEPNILRLFTGKAQASFTEDLICLIETNIDNMNPELYDHVIASLMKSGALDAYITAIRMKKGRPGVLLAVLCGLEQKEKVMGTLFSETTTLGARTSLVKREKLQRSIKSVRTKYGKVRLKIGRSGHSIKNISPEYEDCARIARIKGVPLKSVYDAAKAAFMP